MAEQQQLGAYWRLFLRDDVPGFGVIEVMEAVFFPVRVQGRAFLFLSRRPADAGRDAALFSSTDAAWAFIDEQRKAGA